MIGQCWRSCVRNGVLRTWMISANAWNHLLSTIDIRHAYCQIWCRSWIDSGFWLVGIQLRQQNSTISILRWWMLFIILRKCQFFVIVQKWMQKNGPFQVSWCQFQQKPFMSFIFLRVSGVYVSFVNRYICQPLYMSTAIYVNRYNCQPMSIVNPGELSTLVHIKTTLVLMTCPAAVSWPSRRPC